ncbi:hypothetical protein EJV47_07120 [Hymenobacter gummosus]|uniref:Histidine kinase/HSP90-like ATPase domain-containing protein n=1 Tax=Hymenobacter gummosus TaxID=1776032 RepID=A0A3S0IQ70_9BACT|nr:sensor histidine kinase [Hymenobacter gummosus]RTQ51563.1 hypothetical protein EJV47_07120 [Hymenobacter gummosus]
MPQLPFLRCLLFLLLLLGLRPAGRAQGWQPDATLSRLLIHQLVQDPSGLLWVAAEEGLFRYDGYDLVPLADLAALPPGLRLDRAVVLTLDKQQRLWIGSSRGLFCLQGRRLTQLALPGVGTAPVVVNALLRHPRSGALWVGYADEAVAVFADAARPGRRVPLALGTPAVWLGPADDSAVWAVSAAHRVAYCTPRRGTVRPYRPVAELRPLAGTRPLQLLGTRSLYQEQPDGTLRPVLRWLPGRDEANFVPGQRGSDWQWAVAGQLVQLSRRPGASASDQLPQVRLSPAAFERAGQLPRPYTVVTDANGLRWAYCPSQRGCYKQRAGAEAIEALPSRPLARYSTRTILRLPDGRLLVSAYGAALVQPADSPQAPLRPWPLYEHGRPSEAVLLDALSTPAGQVVFAEENHPFGLLDYRRGQLRRLALPATDTAFISSLCVLRDSSGAVWGGSSRGLFRLDLARAQARPYQHPGRAALPFDKLEIQKIAAAPGGWLWLATSGGLYYLHPPTGRLRHFGTAEAGPARLPTDDLLSAWAAADGSAWVATRAAGLLRVHPRQGLRRQLTTATGLPSNTVGTVLTDGQGQVWAGTFAGLVRYDPVRGRLTVFNETDGLADAELNRQSAWRAPDGELYFGGVGGLHRVLPARAAGGRQRAPRLLLSAYTQHHSRPDTTQTHHLPGPRPPALTLAPTDAFVELHLALTDYLAPEQARFEYRLTGSADERWRPLGNTHVLSLRGLPAGDYTVALRGVSGRGVAARNELRVPLTVQAVWWRRPWAWLLAAALLGAGLYGLHRRRLARVRRVERLRSRIAADLHDEVGTLLTRVSLQAELLRQTQPEANPTLDRLLSNSRQAAGTMRDIVWGIDAQADTAGALLDRMRDHLDQTAAPAGLATELHVRGLRDAQPLPPELRQHLYLIFKEAVSNAARHAQGATRLDVTLAREAGTLTLRVEDDGRPTGAATRSGMGRRNMQQRAGLLHGTLTAEARPQGFVVSLQVPF